MIDPLRRRVLLTLFGAAAASNAAFYAFATVGPLVALELTGSRAWSGLPVTCSVLGAAVGASLVTALMARAGRRAGLRAGFGVGLAGAALALGGAATGRFTLFLGGGALMGVAHAATLLARYAAADVVPAPRRAAALGAVLWSGTLGAAIGPNLPRLAGPLGLEEPAGGLALVAVCYAVALAVAIALRPDPSALAVAAEEPGDGGDAAPVRPPDLPLALVALVLGQAAMIILMTATPVHVHQSGAGVGFVGIVMASHFVGMFGLSPLFGWLAPRVGATALIVAGMVITIAAGVGAAAAPHGSLVALWLLLLGLGWSASYVAGSALVGAGLAPAARLRLQGTVDAALWLTSAIASVLAGLGLELVGYVGVSVAAAACAAAPIAFLVARRVRAWNHARA